MKKILLLLSPIFDLLLVPFVWVSAGIMKLVRAWGIGRLPISKSTLLNVGVFPVLDHFYEPKFNYTDDVFFKEERNLTGLDLNIEGQLLMLTQFCHASELKGISVESGTTGEFYMNNTSFEAGDAEYWYQMIRTVKPAHIVEIGSGYSTLMAIRAIRKNRQEDSGYRCEHICIEPFGYAWLAGKDIKLITERVEKVDRSLFSRLGANDILFIDSSHMIRPGGDVLHEYLELLPALNKGVIVHVHDIFTPRNYPRKWLMDDVRFWNEQYLLEAFLTHNTNWQVIGALNYLKNHYYEQLKKTAPYLDPSREPASFYIKRI